MKNTATAPMKKNTRQPAVLATSIAALVALSLTGLAPNAKADIYWDGPGTAANGIIDGGNGTWDATTTTNWTNAAGSANFTYIANPNPAHFLAPIGGGGSGTVNVVSNLGVGGGINFDGGSYTINSSGAGNFNLGIADMTVNLNSGTPVTEIFNVGLINAGALIVNNGGATGNTLILTNTANNYSGGTTLNGTSILLNNAATSALGSGAVTIAGNGSTFGATGNAGAVVIGNLVNVNANFNLTSGVGGLSLNGGMNLGASTHTITGVNGNSVTLNGTISGAAGTGVTYDGINTKITYGTAETSTYTGLTTVQNNASLTLNSNGSNTAITGNLTISNGAVFLSQSNQIADTATVTVNTGGGFVLLSHNETIATLNSGANGGTVNLGIGGILTVNSGNFSGNIIDAGGGVLVKNGLAADVLTLSGTNTYSGGGTIINSGTIKAGSVSALSAGSAFSLNGVSSVLDLAGNSNTILSLTGTPGSTVESTGAPGTLKFGDAGNQMFAGNFIDGAGGKLSLIKQGAGIEIVTGVNTYTGTTTIVAGAIQAGSTTALGTNSAFTVQNTATLDVHGFNNTIGSLSDGGTVGGLVVSNTGTGILTTGGDNTSTTFHGQLQDGSGKLGIIKTGTGTMLLTNANNYSGTTTINGGAIKAGATTALSSTSAFTLGAGGTLDLGGFNNTIGSLAGVAGAIVTNNSISPAVLTTNGDNSNTVFAGIIQNGSPAGVLSLVKTGTGILKLGGVNTYTGTTTISQGTLQMGVANALSTQTAVTVAAGATFDLNGNNNLNQSIGSLAGAATSSVLLGNATLTTGNDNTNTSFAGVISGTGVLTKVGTGTFTLNGPAANTYSGGTNVNNGVVLLNDTQAFSAVGTGPLVIGDNVGAPQSAVVRLGAGSQIGNQAAVTINSDGLLDLNNFNDTVGSVTSASATAQITLGSGTLTTGDATNTTYAGLVVGSGNIVKTGIGAWTLSGSDTHTGTTTINVGAIKAGVANVFAAQSAYTVVAGATLDLNGFNNSIGSLTGAGTVKDTGAAPATLTITGNNGAPVNFSGKLIDDGVLSLVKNGPGTQILSGSGVNTYSGSTTVNGGILQAGALNAFSPNSATLVNTGGTLDLAGNNNIILSLNDSGAPGGTVESTIGSATLTFGDANNLTFHGNIINGGGTLAIVKQGTGTETLAGNNTYTGTTTINGGKLLAASPNAFSFSAFTVNNTGTLDLGGFNETIASLAGTAGGTVQNSTATPATLTTGGNGTNTNFAGNIIDGAGASLSLTKVGAGTQVLSGVNTYSGLTTITAGAISAGSTNGLSPNSVFVVQSAGTLSLAGKDNTIAGLSDGGGTGGIVQDGGAANATLTFGNGANLRFSGVIQDGIGGGKLSLIKQGAGTETFTGANVYSGTTTINAGVLQGGATNTFSVASALTINAAGTLDMGGFNQAIGSLAGVAGAKVVNTGVGAATLTTNGDNTSTVFAGVISDGSPINKIALTKVGTGTLKLAGVNTYTGATTISAGTLQMGIANALSIGTPVSVASGATFDVNDFSQSIGSLAGVAGSFVKLGVATPVIATLTTGNDNTNTSFAGIISGTGALTKVGTGTFTIAGPAANTYSGGTNVNNGVLLLNNVAAFGAVGTGPLVIGDSVGAPLSAVTRLLSGSQIGSQVAVTINSDGLLDLNNFSETTRSIAGASATAQINLGSGTLTNGDATNTTFAGSIVSPGGGNIVKQGTGTWTLSGVNTYSGTTTVNAGVLKAGSATGFAQFSAFTVNANSTLDLGGNSSNIGSLAGGGALSFVQSTGGAATLTTGSDNTSTAYSGIIQNGTGPLSLVKVGSGTQTLSGANTYSGGTVFNSGGLHVNNNFALGTGTLKIFNLAPGGTTLGSTVAGIVFANAIEIHADFAVDPVFGGVGTLKATGPVTLFGTHTITGTNTNTFEINGAVGESAAGTGIIFDPVISSNFVYSGPLANTYTGLTTVEGGATLTLFKDNPGVDAIPSGGLKVQDTATVILKQNEQINDAATVTLVNSGIFNLNGFKETVKTLNTSVNTKVRLDDGAVGGTLTVMSGLVDGLITDNGVFPGGNLIKNGGPGDVLTLTNDNNNYNGFTTLNGGVLNINAGGALGDSTFEIKGNDDVVIGNTSGGTVFFFQTTNIYKDFSVNGPDLLTATGTVTLRQLDTTINTVAGGLNFSGSIGEFNPLSKLTFVGNTATTLSGGSNNTYTGLTDLQGGILTLSKTGNKTAIAGDLKIALGTTAKYGAGAAATDNQIALGSTVYVDGTLDLNGHNQEIHGLYGDGDVRLGNGALTPGKLTVNVGIFAGNIMDAGPSGQLVKNTPGTLILTGKNTLTGTTSVQKGSLILDGSVGGDVNVSGPGFLGGTGWIGGSLFNNGVVSPGHSPGTLTVNGNFAQSAGGLLKIEVGGLAPNEHDLLAIHGAAFLNGTVEVIRTNNFALKRHDKVIFLTADGGVNGTFSNELNQFHVGNALLDGVIIYEPFDVALTLVQNSFLDVLNHFTRNGLTPNQKAVAKALDGVLNDPRMDAALNFLDNEPLGNIPHDLDLIAAEEMQSLYTIGISQANVQSSNLERRMDDIRNGTHGFSASGYAVSGGMPQYSGSLEPSSEPGLSGPEGKGGKEIRPPLENPNMGIFVTGVGEFTHVGDTYNASGYDLATGGFTLGVDYRIGDHFAIGINAGYARTSADLFGNGRVSVDGGKLGVYATFFTGGFYADLSAQGGYNSYDVRRTALAGTARGTTNGGEFNALFATGYDFKTGGLSIGPTASVQYTYVGFRGFTETGSLLPLAYNKQNGDSLRTSVGMKASYDWQIGGITVRPELRAAWQHEFDNTEFAINSRFANGAGKNFTVHGAETGRESLLLGAGVAVLWNERTSTYVYYDGEIGRTNFDSHNVSGGVRLSF